MLLDTWTTLDATVQEGFDLFDTVRMITVGRTFNKSTMKSRLTIKIDMASTAGKSGHTKMLMERYKANVKEAFAPFERALRSIPALNSDYAMPTLKFYDDNTVAWHICGVHIGGIDSNGIGVCFDQTTTPALLNALQALPMPCPDDTIWMLAKPAGPRPVGKTAFDAYALFYTLQVLPKAVDVSAIPNPLPEIGLCQRSTVDRKAFLAAMTGDAR